MNINDLIQPDHQTQIITVAGADLARTEQRLRATGAVILGFAVKGSTYTLRVIMPPRVLLEKWGQQQGQAPQSDRNATGQ